MVGTVIFKNFETGSYEYMRVTVYEGVSYADIDRGGSFSSCLVSPERKSVSYDCTADSRTPRLGMSKLLEVCRMARELLWENEYITMADFCENESGITVRKRSANSGIYSPVDMRAVFDMRVCDVYRLCAELREDTYLCSSVRCALLNCCMGRLLDTEEEAFGISGCGLYMNMALFAGGRSLRRADIPCGAGMPAAKPVKSRLGKGARRAFAPPELIEEEQSIQPRRRLISAWRSARLKALRHCAAIDRRAHGESIALSLAEDGYIHDLAREFALLLREYIANYDFCFRAPSHMDFVCLRDAFGLISDIADSEQIAERAAALSANMKIRQKLPCPDYYDSYGKAYYK